MIEKFDFGRIKIGDTFYEFDVEVRSDGKVLNWVREKGHVFLPEDIKRALSEKPEIIILGTGVYGKARVPQKTRKKIQEHGARLVIDKTKEAVRSFNMILKKNKEAGLEEKLIGLFHLTC